MDSREIFQQYNIGAMSKESAMAELEKLLRDTSSFANLEEAARARYVVGFLHRAEQYRRGTASEKDLCLNIRDVLLIFGRMRLATTFYRIAENHGTRLGLMCEGEGMVSCVLQTCAWLEPAQYIKEVYDLRFDGNTELEQNSAGDDILRSNTIFRHYKNYEQKLAVYTALNLPLGDTLLLSQPTGGGKSLVTQLLASTSRGLTVVIVPTVALAMDQFSSANTVLKDNSEIYCYRGDQCITERMSILSAIRKQSARLLFTSPEAVLKNTELYALLGQAAENGYLVNVVIDEAHVVPDWGVFFRPDFQLFSIALKKWRAASQNRIRTFLLSATLTDTVVSTLFTLFGEEGHNVQMRCDALRQEPRFYFTAVKSREEQANKTIEAAELLPKPLVVYVLEPKEARALQNRFLREGYKNIPVFTGETAEEERNRVLTGWKQNQFDIVIATSAFGIGVDKPDVRTVIHACCPENLSRYYQEVGRGGRDRLPSLSLFMPYKNPYDKDSDVRRALGLVNKRVLTVDKTVLRWQSMLQNPATIIEGDNCVLDTTTPPITLSEEESEYAGNRNMYWNVNLLLFLHRTGYIDLLDVNFDSQRKAYTVTVHMNRPELLGDSEKLAEELNEPRQQEYKAQMEDYYVIRDLVESPRNNCWGRVFRRLFPLSKEVCHGCPCDPKGRVTTDSRYKIRSSPKIALPPAEMEKRLKRRFGSYEELVISRRRTGPCSEEEIETLCQHANQNKIGAIILPERFANKEHFSGLTLNYDEFFFAVDKTPYVFSRGVLCVLDDESNSIAVFKNLNKLKHFHYRRILYANEGSCVTANGQRVRDCIEGYSIPVERL